VIQILSIVAYSFDGRSRAIEIKPGSVNIISGDSRTGKSATLEVVNYCFGSKEIHVPEGKIRRNVAWFWPAATDAERSGICCAHGARRRR